MEALKIIFAVFDKYGAWGLIALYIGYKLLLPVWKKRNGSWVSYRDFEKQRDELRDLQIDFEKMKSSQEEINKSIFRRLDQLHDSFNKRFEEIRETMDRNLHILTTLIKNGGK